MYEWSPYLPLQRPAFEQKLQNSGKIREKIGENHAWTVFWCYMTVFMKDWHWRSYLDMGLANWSKVLTANYPCDVFLRKNGSLGVLRRQWFIAFLVVDWACYSFLTVWGVLHMDYIMGLNTLEERVRKSVGKKMTVSDQSNQQMLFKRGVLVNF